MTKQAHPRSRLNESIDRIYAIAVRAGEIPPDVDEDRAKKRMQKAQARCIKRCLRIAEKVEIWLNQQEAVTKH